MKYYQITPKGCNTVTDTLENINGYIQESEVGDILEIEVIEMTEEEYKALPESDGF